MTTYYLRNTTSDLTGGGLNFDYSLLGATTTAATIAIGGNPSDYGSAFTSSGVPGASGGVATYTVEMNVVTANADVTELSVQIHRVNSTGTVQSSSAVSATQSGATTGVKTFTFTDLDLGTWATGDRLRVDYRANATTGHGTRTVDIQVNTVDAEVVVASAQNVAVNQVTESDTAQTISRVTSVAVGQAVETSAARVVATQVYPYVHAASANDRYLVDASSNPVTNLFDTIWPMIQIAGRDNSDDWRGDLEHWIDTRASQGFTGLKWTLFAQEINGAPADLLTYDNVSPFDTTSPTTADISQFNEAYWERVDYLIDKAWAKGLTCWIHVMYKDDVSHPSGTGWLEGHANADYTAFGTALGNRYKDRQNIVWVYGGDYFDESATQMELIADAVVAAGDSHLVTVQNMADSGGATYYSTSRYKTQAPAGDTVLGNAIATIDGLYVYGTLYEAAQTAYQDTPALPVVYYDGYYDGGDALRLRRDMGWALTSGAYASHYGDEGLWSGPVGWRTGMSAVSTLTTMLGILEGLAGWEGLVPDWSSAFITAGRGTGNSYVTGAKNAAGTLAFIYMPNAASAITVDMDQMGASSRTATWIDPVDGSTTAETVATTYSTSATNAAGGTDWFLVLEASTGTPVGLTTETDTAQATGKAKRRAQAQGSTADTGQAVSRVKSKTLGLGW